MRKPGKISYAHTFLEVVSAVFFEMKKKERKKKAFYTPWP